MIAKTTILSSPKFWVNTTTFLRLCRLTCGRPGAFRGKSLGVLRGYAPAVWGVAPEMIRSDTGKSETCRTSGGRAAIFDLLILLGLFLSLTLGFTSAKMLAAEPAAQAAPDNSTAGLDHLRAALKEAYNRGDPEAMARYLHPDVVIIFPDGSVLKGREALRDYYNRMLKAPGHRVVSYSAEPSIESRTVHNDVGLSYGYMNDQYVLNDGKSFGLNSRFSVTLFRTPDGPPDTDGWMIRSFHSSADTFDNPILTMVAKRVFWMAGIGGLLIGALLGLGAGALLFRRKKAAAGV